MMISVEQTPNKIEKGLSDIVLTHSDQITIPHLPGSRLSVSRKAVDTLVERDDVNPSTIVPHVAARNIQSKVELTKFLNGVYDIGVRNLIVIGGSDRVTSKSVYHSAFDMIDGNDKKINRFNIAIGYDPLYCSTGFLNYEGVTQLNLSVSTLAKQELFVRVGVPSMASPDGLWRYIKMCGVGPSIRYPLRNILGLLRYTHPTKGFKTVQFMNDVTAARGRPTNFHVYDFGRIDQTLIEITTPNRPQLLTENQED